MEGGPKKPKGLRKIVGKLKKLKTRNKKMGELSKPNDENLPPQAQYNVVKAPVAPPAVSAKPPAKIEKRFGSYLLAVSKEEFNAANEYFKQHPTEVKIKKGTVLKDSQGKAITITHSIVGMKNTKGVVESYAMANREYLGEGAYGRVKIAQNSQGQTFAVKIEGKAQSAEETAEEKISKFIGYLKGTVTRKLDSEKEFKGKKTKDKTYSIYTLRRGKEIFEHIYTNILKPGHLYTKEEQEQYRRRNNEELSVAQRLITAFKSCQVVQDLHNRGVVHGDLKPANLMANIQGNQIVVAAIDHGFSFQLDKTKVPPQTHIEHESAPEGTHPHYMPPEVRIASKNSDEYQPGRKAYFSTASDVYSLGIMFEDDMLLPVSVTQNMTSPAANMRDTLKQVIEKLIVQLENLPAAERTVEIDNIIKEHRLGVKRFEEDKGPQVKDSFVGQLMSGFRDPRESVGDATKSTTYTTDEYHEMAIGIYDSMSQVTFFEELQQGYQKLQTAEEKGVYIHNATLFIKELLKLDIKGEYLKGNQNGISAFAKVIIPEQRGVFEAEIAQVLTDNKARVAVPEQLPGEVLIDIEYFLENGVNDAAMSKEQREVIVDAFAEDLKEQQFKLLKDVSPLDFLAKKQEKDKTYQLPFNKMIDLYNRISTKVIHDIIHGASKEHQKNIYAFYVQLLDKSIEKGDFNTAGAILGGLKNTALSRLSYLNQDAGLNARINAATQLFSAERNSKALRDEIQRKIDNNIPIVPLPSLLLNGLVNLAENATVSDVTRKLNGDKIQGIGHEINLAIVENQERAIKRVIKPGKTNINFVLNKPLQTQNNYYDVSVSILPRGQQEPDFSKVRSQKATQDQIAASHQAVHVQIEDIKRRIAEVNSLIAVEYAKDPKDIKKLVEIKKTLKGLQEEEKILLNFEKNNTEIVREARTIQFDDSSLKKIDVQIKNYLMEKVREYFAKNLNEDDADDLYDIIRAPEIYGEMFFTDDLKPFVQAVERNRTLQMLKGDESDPADIVLEKLFKQYSIKVYEQQKDQEEVDKARQEHDIILKSKAKKSDEVNRAKAKLDAVVAKLSITKQKVENLNSQCRKWVNIVKEASTSSDNEIKAAAATISTRTKDMVEKYTILSESLAKKSEPKPKNDSENFSNFKAVKKSIKNLAKKTRLISRKEASANSKIVQEPKDLMSLINALREETHKRNREKVEVKSSIPKAADPAVRAAAGVGVNAENSIGIEFEVPSIPAPLPVTKSDAPARMELPVIIEPIEDSPAIIEFKELQKLLSEPQTRNQIRIEAMKKGVGALRELPKENTPKSFADIVKTSFIVDESNPQARTTKEAAKTILAVIISPKAGLNELIDTREKMLAKIADLKKVVPMTTKIKNKIILREQVAHYVNDILTKKLANKEAQHQEVSAGRPLPIIPTKQVAKTNVVNQDNIKQVELFKKCIEDFQYILDHINESTFKVLFQEGTQPKVTMMRILNELRQLDPLKATTEDVNRLILQGKDCWSNDVNSLKANPLMRLKEQLPNQQGKNVARPNQ